MLLINGPCDNSLYAARLGGVYAAGSPELFRQATQQFLRASTLDPTNTDYSIWLANLFLKLKQPEKTLETLQKLKAPIVAARSVDTDEGQVLLLWLRQLPTFEELQEYMDSSDEENEMDDFDDDDEDEGDSFVS